MTSRTTPRAVSPTTAASPRAAATSLVTSSKGRKGCRATASTRRASSASTISSAAVVGVATPTVTTATTMAAVTPGAAIPAAVVPRTAAVAAPLFGAAKLLHGLLRGGPQHRGLSRVMSPTKGGHQGQRWSRLLLPPP